MVTSIFSNSPTGFVSLVAGFTLAITLSWAAKQWSCSFNFTGFLVTLNLVKNVGKLESLHSVEYGDGSKLIPTGNT